MRTVKSALLGSSSTESQCDSLRLDGRVVCRGHSQLTRLIEHRKATRDGGVTLSWDHGPAEVFPHTGTPETAVCWVCFIPHRREKWITAYLPLLLSGLFLSLMQNLCYILVSQTLSVLCAFLSCVDKTFSLLCTLCSSRASLLSETFPLWASLCVGRHVCERLVGGRRPAANSTYCCIAGARLSGSLPAIWLKGFVWHFRGSQSYPSCLTLGLWSMCVSIWWVAKRQPCEPFAKPQSAVDFSAPKMRVHSHSCHFTCPPYPSQGDFASDTRDSKVHFWSGAWGDTVTSSSGQAISFRCSPRTTLKIYLCQIELRVEGCKLESGVVETAHTW